MRAPFEGKAVLVSLRCYQRLLAVYPKCHRRDYGLPMAQLFRDQCRDAWRESRSWGLVALWLRVLPDLVKTSFLEHLSAMKARKSMVEKISELTKINPSPLRTFFTVFIVVFLLVFVTSALVTFLLPESFRSTTRVKVDRNAATSAGPNESPAPSSVYDPYFLQTEFEVIQSEVVLGKVIETLDLNAEWGKRYAGGAKLKTPETMALLKSRLDLRPVRSTTLIEISVYGEERDEPAAIANAIAEAYREYRLRQQFELAGPGLAALKNQFEEQDRKVREAQAQVDQFRRELEISELDPAADSAAGTLDAETVRQLQAQLIGSKSQLAKEEIQLKELKRLGSEQRRDAIQTVVGGDGELSTLLSERDLAQQKLAGLAKDYAPEHPEYQKARIMADEMAKRISQRVDGIMIGLETRVRALQSTTDRLQAELENARLEDIKKAERSRPYFEAKRRLDELTRFRSVLGLKLTSEKLDMNLPKSSMVEIIDRAMPATRPIRPNKAFNLFLGAVAATLLGTMVGGAAAWGRVRVRRKTPSSAAAA